MTKSEWLTHIPRSETLTLEDAMAAVDVVLSEAMTLDDERAWRRPELRAAVESLENLERGLDVNLARGVQRFAPREMQNLRRVLVERGFDLLDQLDAAESSVGGGDPLYWSPSAVRAELDRIRGVLNTVDAEARQAAVDKKITSDELRLWTEGAYKPGIAFIDGASTFWGSNAIAARTHEANAGKWRAFLEARGGQLKGPRDLVREDKVAWEIPVALIAAAILVFAVKWKD